MKTNRIIMADPDLQYIIKLQIKFLQELQNAYEIDVITDREYFEESFKTPQNATCLIINEKWTTMSLAKHNIDHTVVLTYGASDDSDIPATRTGISRYTSTEEIYIQVRSILGVDWGRGKKEDATVLYFGSASGGTGKTVLSLALAEHLSGKYYRVLYINTQSAQSFQYYMRESDAIHTATAMALLEENADVYETLKSQIRGDKFSYLLPFAMPLYSYGINRGIYPSFIGSVKTSREYDYIVIDGGSDLTSDTTEQIALADKVIMVLKPEEEYHYALKLMLKKINLREEKLIKLCNMVNLNPVKNAYGHNSIEISESVSEWKTKIDSDTIHDFSKSDDIRKLAVLIG